MNTEIYSKCLMFVMEMVTEDTSARVVADIARRIAGEFGSDEDDSDPISAYAFAGRGKKNTPKIEIENP